MARTIFLFRGVAACSTAVVIVVVILLLPEVDGGVKGVALATFRGGGGVVGSGSSATSTSFAAFALLLVNFLLGDTGTGLKGAAFAVLLLVLVPALGVPMVVHFAPSLARSPSLLYSAIGA